MTLVDYVIVAGLLVPLGAVVAWCERERFRLRREEERRGGYLFPPAGGGDVSSATEAELELWRRAQREGGSS